MYEIKKNIRKKYTTEAVFNAILAISADFIGLL